MYRTAVVALGVVLKEQLPISLHFVLDGPGNRQLRHVEAVEPADQGLVGLSEWLGIVRQVNEEEPLPALDADGTERIVGLGEAFDLGGRGRANEPSVQCVGPGMVGTLNRLGKAASVLLAETGSPVAT